ncbi:MAG TPA: TlpA disulfide reductase family protein [Burkholderiales bacterium]|nr:TlpA disulfide reductase family protein [Burkholderiales bacterium]
MRPARRSLIALAGIAATAAAAGALVGALLRQTGSGASKLLDATFPDLEGRTRRLLEWQGRPLVCNFWATWCAPCREEIPLLAAAKQQHAAYGLEVIGIGIDSADKIRDFAANFGIKYPILVAGGEAIGLMRELGNKSGGLPFSVLVDRSGAISSSKLGAYTHSELQAALSALLG